MGSYFKFDGEIQERFKISKKTKTPLEYIYSGSLLGKEEKFVSLKNTIDLSPSQLSTLQEIEEYPISLSDYLLCYYQSQKDSRSLKYISNEILKFLEEIDEDSFRYEQVNIFSRKTEWDSRWRIQYTLTERKFKKISSFFEDIEDFTVDVSEKDLEETYSSISLDSIIHELSVENKEDLSPDFGIFIFNECIPSKFCPFVKFIDENGQTYYKNFEERNVEDYADYFQIFKSTENVIYSLVFLDNVTDYVEVKIDLVKRKIHAKIKNEYTKLVGELRMKLTKTFPSIRFSDSKEDSLSGTFDITFPNYSDEKFYALVHTDEIFSKVIHIKEASSARGLGNKNKYYFKEPSNIKDDDYAISFRIERTASGRVKFEFKTKPESYIGLDKLKEFIHLLHRLKQVYEDVISYSSEEEVKEESLVIYYMSELIRENYSEEYGHENLSKINNLRSRNPENMYLKSKYSRNVCGCKTQPIIVDEEDVEDWENYNRKVILFPPKESSLGSKNYYVCPGDDFTNPYLRKTPKDYTKNYPYLPCCKKTRDEEDIDFERVRLEGENKEDKRSKIVLKTLKPLKNKGKGEIPPFLNNWLKKVYPSASFKRFGNKMNNLSFIHSVLRGVIGLEKRGKYDDRCLRFIKEYLEDGMSDAVPEYIRDNLDKLVKMECLKQELYDMTIDEIKDYIKRNIFFDPRLFYRTMEIIFNINIFVLSYEDDETFYLEKPRFNFFHVRNFFHELPSIIVLKHSRDFHCELIVAQSLHSLQTKISIGGLVSLFDKKMTKFLEKSYRESSYDIISQKRFRKNPFDRYNWRKIFGSHQITSQHINSDGKAYAFNVKLEEGDVTVYVPPSQPLNVKMNAVIHRKESDVVKKYFGEGEKGSEGIWYSVSELDKIFIPCTDMFKDYVKLYSFRESLKKEDDEEVVKKNSTVLSGSSNSSTETEEGDVCNSYLLDKERKEYEDIEDYRLVRKNSFILTQLVNWCWRHSDMDVDTFFRKYFSQVDEVAPLKEIPYILERKLNVRDAINHLQKYWSIFSKGKINVYSDLADSLYLYLRGIERRSYGLKVKPLRTLIGIFESEKDFSKIPGVKVNIGYEKFNEWFDYRLKQDKSFVVKENITVEDFDKKSFIYKMKNGRIYIIFNPRNRELTNVLVSSYIWNLRKVVDAPNVKIMRELKSYNYVIYKQNGRGELKISKIVDSDEAKDKKYHEVFEYRRGNFMAMLPLI